MKKCIIPDCERPQDYVYKPRCYYHGQETDGYEPMKWTGRDGLLMFGIFMLGSAILTVLIGGLIYLLWIR